MAATSKIIIQLQDGMSKIINETTLIAFRATVAQGNYKSRVWYGNSRNPGNFVDNSPRRNFNLSSMGNNRI